jgi:hypothetical protein
VFDHDFSPLLLCDHTSGQSYACAQMRHFPKLDTRNGESRRGFETWAAFCGKYAGNPPMKRPRSRLVATGGRFSHFGAYERRWRRPMPRDTSLCSA